MYNTDSFVIILNGIEYNVDVLKSPGNTEIYIDNGEYDIEGEELLMVTNYLIDEGFVEGPNPFKP